MRDALTWALRYNPDPAALQWAVAVLAAAFFGLLLFAVFQYQTSKRRWGMKLVLGLLGCATVVGLGASACRGFLGLLYGLGYLLTWFVWVLTRRWSWWRRALARGLISGLSLGPWLWIGATERDGIPRYAFSMARYLLESSRLEWFWMLLGALWMLVLLGGWGCWRWPVTPARRRWVVAAWAVLGVLGLNWYAAGRVDFATAAERGQCWRLGYVLLSRPGSQWYRVSGGTALHRATPDGGRDAIRLLLAAGADVNAKGCDAETPLHLAAADGKAEVIRLLLAAGADVNARNKYGSTPLHSVVASSNLEAIHLLLNAGADLKARDDGGRMPLHVAAWGGGVVGIRVLLTAGADVNDRTEYGEPPLYYAAHGSHVEAVRFLLAAGADVNARNEDGEAPLDIAKGDECRKLLRAAGGKTGKELDSEKPAPPQ